MPPIYVDFDYTLSYPLFVGGDKRKLDRIVFRPGADAFLDALSNYGDPVLLTASEGGWAESALRGRKDLRGYFRRIITGEDLFPVERQLQEIFRLEGVSDAEKLELVALISPIAESGVIFDDQEYGSDAWYVKSVAVGNYGKGPDLWVRVTRFDQGHPDHKGLEQAFRRFRRRNDEWTGRLGNSVELSGGPGYNPLAATF